MGFTNLNFKKSKVKMQFNQNPKFGDKHLIIQSLTIPCDPYKIQSSIPLILVSLLLLFFFFSLSLFSPSLYGLVLQNETKFVLKPMFVKAMFGQDKKTHFFCFNFSFLHLSPLFSSISIPTFSICLYSHNLLNFYFCIQSVHL